MFGSARADRQIDRPTSLHGDVYEQPDEEDIPTHGLPPFGRRVVQHQAESNVAAEPEAQGKDDPFPGDGCFARRCHSFHLQELMSFVKKGQSVLEWCGEHSLFGKAITCVAATTLLEQGMEDQRVGSENGLGYQCFGLASGLPFYLVKEVIGLGQSEGGCHAVHTMSRVDGAGPLLRHAG